jgi:hypothetical protein
VTDKGEERRGWFVLVYKLPAEPTRLRASVWRKLKAAGAVYLQNGVAALPADAAGERAMRGAAQEVRDLGGTAHLLRGEALGDEAALVEAFGEAWLRKVELRDHFGAPKAPEAMTAVLACREDLEAFATSVYEAADHGSAGPAPSGP